MESSDGKTVGNMKASGLKGNNTVLVSIEIIKEKKEEENGSMGKEPTG